MRNRPRAARNGWRNLIVTTAGIVALAVPVFLGLMATPRLRAQAPTGQSPAAQSLAVPQWQTDAGGQMAFDVASVKEDAADPSSANSNIPLSPRDAFVPTGGLFSATNQSLVQYLVFAYKLTPNQVQHVTSQLPKWANNARYDIQARASGNPAKDQFRLMMQVLLADRFKLAVHFETRQLPVYALVLDKPGKLGPHFQAHPGDPPCSTAPEPSPEPTIAGGFPLRCGALAGLQSSLPSHIRAGSRNISIATLATILSTLQQLFFGDRPILDRTGLAGNYDFVIEWAPDPRPGANAEADPSGPTFLEALKDQLGLKLVPQTGPVDVLVIDHVEEPSPN